jgi:predicted phosphodiesterase
MPYNNLELIERQPLGVLYGCGVFEHLRDQVFQDGDFRVRVVGVPYNPKRTLDQLKAIQKQPGDDFLVCIVHALATENPPSKLDDFFGETVFRYADLVTPDGPDVWAFGHWHRDQGVMQVGGKWFVNQGAVSRGALTHENIMRTPQVALIEFEATGPLIQTIPLIVAPASDVFDMERKERADAELNKIEDFILLLHNDSSFDSEQSAEDNIRAMQDVASDVRDLALEYLANAREG